MLEPFGIFNMNSWKFNSTANYFLRFAISELLELDNPSDVYKLVKCIKANKIILKDGRELKLKIEK